MIVVIGRYGPPKILQNSSPEINVIQDLTYRTPGVYYRTVHESDNLPTPPWILSDELWGVGGYRALLDCSLEKSGDYGTGYPYGYRNDDRTGYYQPFRNFKYSESFCWTDLWGIGDMRLLSRFPGQDLGGRDVELLDGIQVIGYNRTWTVCIQRRLRLPPIGKGVGVNVARGGIPPTEENGRRTP